MPHVRSAKLKETGKPLFCLFRKSLKWYLIFMNVMHEAQRQTEILPLSADTRDALMRVARHLGPRRDNIVARWTAAFLDSPIKSPSISDEAASELIARLVDVFLEHVERAEFDEYFAEVRALFTEYSDVGLSFDSFVLAIHLGEKAMLPILMREHRQPEELESALLSVDQLFHNVLALSASTYFGKMCLGLSRRNEELSALFAVTSAVSSSLDIDVILDRALDEVLKSTSLSAGEVLILNPETGRLELRAFRGLPDAFAERQDTFAIGEGLPGAVAERGKPIIVPDFPSDPRFVSGPSGGHYQLRYAIGIPLLARDRVVGVMDFFGTEVLLLDAQDIKLLASIGNEIGTAIDKATLHQTVQLRSQELEEARRRREEFISMVVHEFRGPLTVLTGYAQLLSRAFGKCEKCDARLPSGALAQTRRLARLVDDLADASKIEDGRFQMYKSPVDLVALVREVVEQQQATADKHQLVFETQDLPVIVDLDHDRVVQVLTNLVSNAIKYSPDGGEVKIAVARLLDEVEVSILDGGLGIAEEDLPQLFQPFSRLYHRQEIKGTGLGLYITKGIVEAHGGRIWAVSKLGEGSAFHITLPLS